MKTLGALIFSLVLCSKVAGQSVSLPAGFYPIQPPIEGSVSLGGVSHDGTFAAGRVTVGNTRQMFVWTPSSGSQLIDLPPDHRIWRVTDVSGDGSTVGGQIEQGGPFMPREAFRWTETDGFQLLGTLSASHFDDSYVASMNYDGSYIVGSSDTPNGRRGFRWSQSQGMLDLGTRGSSNSLYDPWSGASQVSDDGSIISGTTTIFGEDSGQMAQWTQSGGWQVFGSLPAEPRNAGGGGMTPDGSIVVGVNQGNGFDGIIWTQAQGIRALPRHPDYYYHSAGLITADGSFITGLGIDSIGGHALAWEKIGSEYQPKLLSQLFTERGLDLGGWRIWSVNTLSPNGRVLAGTAYDTQGRTRGYIAVLPIPEPCSLLLVAMAAVGLLVTVRIRVG